MKTLHIFFYVYAVWCRCLQGKLPMIFSLKGLVGSVLSINVHYVHYPKNVRTGVLACICHTHVYES